MGPDGVLREVADSKLLGRGGAAFPTGRKWEAVARNAKRPHYLICNADESEPGTFKDRVILEHDPFFIVEAMTIAGYRDRAASTATCTSAASTRWPGSGSSTRSPRRAPAATSAQDILGQGMRFDIELRKGAGAYICGEETALFNSIEGYRGEPRNKPPFPVDEGLFDKPTVINNVETLVNVPGHRHRGRRRRTRRSAPRTRPARACSACAGASRGRASTRRRSAITLRELLELAGGVLDGRPLRAILLGGAAGPLRHARRARRRDVLRGDARGRGRAWARASSWSSTTPSTCRRSSCAWPRSSATSRAASACRAASARSARRRRSPGSSTAARAGRSRQEYALLDEITRLDARRVDLRPRPDGRRRDRVGAAQARRLRDRRAPMSPRTRTGAPPRTDRADAQRRDRRRRART